LKHQALRPSGVELESAHFPLRVARESELQPFFIDSENIFSHWPKVDMLRRVNETVPALNTL
jgi:hypothetical protein